MSVVNVRVATLREETSYRSLREWMEDDNNVYIGRHMRYVGAPASIWANPYTVKKYGLSEALRLYRLHVEEKLKDRLPELKGKTLGCWCKPEACHGDILLQMVEEL